MVIYQYSQHKQLLGFAIQSASSGATAYSSIATLLVCPFVSRASRFSWGRGHAYENTKQHPSFQFTAPPFPST